VYFDEGLQRVNALFGILSNHIENVRPFNSTNSSF